MANVKITELTGLTANETASTDVLPVVDVSADATKKLAISDLHRSVPDGTLSAPGIAFQSDLNSGLYRSGTDAIALVTNGAARIQIAADGDVTIPNTANITSSEFGSGTAAAPSIAFTGDTDSGIYSPGANQVAVATNGTAAITVDSSQRVGIATTSPGAQLEIGGTTAATGTNALTAFEIQRSDGTNPLITMGPHESAQSSSSPGASICSNNRGMIISNHHTDLSSGEGLFLDNTNSALRLYANNLERMSIDSSGNVLFGKTSQDLSIAGFQHRGAAIGLVQITRDSGEPLQLNRLTNDGKLIEFRQDTTAIGSISVQGSNLGIDVNGSERLTITSTGNAEFGGQVKADSTSGAFQASRSDGAANHVFRGGTSTSNYTSVITANGQLTLSGESGAFQATRSDGSANHIFRAGTSTSNYTTVITAGGAAYFASSVGIGTASPRGNLHLHSSSATRIDLTNTATGTASGDGSTISIDGSTGALNIIQREAQPIIFNTSNTPAARFDSSGRLLVGTTSSVGPDNFLQLVGDSNDEAAITCWRSSDNAGSGGLNFIKTRGTVASPSVASNGDSLGTIRWHAYDGSTFDGRAAQITAEVDGGVAAGDTPGRLVFSTNPGSPATGPTERMRIAANGDILLGTDGIPNGTSIYGAAFQNTTVDRMELNMGTSTTSSIYHIRFFNPNGNVGNIRTSASSVIYETSSDYRLKENVININDGITRVKQLQPKRFNFIADADTTVDGFLAHEAQTVVPEAVTGTHNEVDDDGNPVMQGIDQSKLVPLLTAALQEAIAKIESLETRIAALES